MTRRPSIAVVEDHPLVREALKALIESADDLAFAGDAGDTLMAEVLLKQSPDVLLLDLELPGEHGLALLKRLPASTRALVLTSHTSDVWALAAMRAGARGFLTKSSQPAQVLAAIRAVVAGDVYLDARLAQRLVRTSRTVLDLKGPDGQLTEREFEVLRLVGQAFTNEAIASALDLSVKTVKTHVSAILSKLGAADRTEAAVLAWREGVVRDDDLV